MKKIFSFAIMICLPFLFYGQAEIRLGDFKDSKIKANDLLYNKLKIVGNENPANLFINHKTKFISKDGNEFTITDTINTITYDTMYVVDPVNDEELMSVSEVKPPRYSELQNLLLLTEGHKAKMKNLPAGTKVIFYDIHTISQEGTITRYKDLEYIIQ